MQQRRAPASGRPSGTDGSDFSYRMLVDARYTKVAKGKSRLVTLLAAQSVSLVIGSLWVYVHASQDNFAIVSASIGFLSIIIGELGRRRSLANLLRLFIFVSSIATALSAAYVVRSDFFFKIIQNHSISGIETYNLVEAGRVLLSIVLQILIIVTTVSLVQNMSPKRAS